ncbi:hypothetical protein GCM10020258_38780 [Sphingomonas yabuuchiae]
MTHQASSSDLARFRLMPGFRVKPSDITLPEGLPAGQYRRIFQPFPNWTLVCDENLQKKQKICNVARTIQGPDGGTVFSWSLAAAQDGQPIFILRVPTNVGMGGLIRLVLPDGARLSRSRFKAATRRSASPISPSVSVCAPLSSRE